MYDDPSVAGVSSCPPPRVEEPYFCATASIYCCFDVVVLPKSLRSGAVTLGDFSSAIFVSYHQIFIILLQLGKASYDFCQTCRIEPRIHKE